MSIKMIVIRIYDTDELIKLIEIRIYDTDENKHTSKTSKWNFLPFIALFSC